MSDQELKQELLYMVRLTAKYDFSNAIVVDEIKTKEEQKPILTSVFGQRFLSRITAMSQGKADSRKCVICGRQIAVNGVICEACMEKISTSEYARNSIEIKEKEKKGENRAKLSITLPKIKIPEIKLPAVTMPKIKLPEIKKVREQSVNKSIKTRPEKKKSGGASKVSIWNRLGHSRVLLVCLIIITILNLALIILLGAGSSVASVERNPLEEATVSTHDLYRAPTRGEALKVVLEEFPESDGWLVVESGESEQYVGYFNTTCGDNIDDVIAGLTDEQRFDFFFTEPCFVFMVSYKDEVSAKMGVVEVNRDGKVIVQGSFNNGRATNSFYRIR